MDKRTNQQNNDSICYIETMEEWKDIKNYNAYQVSSLGRIKAKAKIVRWKHHGKEGYANKKEKIIKGTPRVYSKFATYLQVRLKNHNGYKAFHIHRLVASAFLENRLGKQQVNHIDGDGTNNNVKNLEWVTQSENTLHAYRVLGRRVWHKGSRGEMTPTAKPVLQKNINGDLIRKWACGLDAVREGGFESSGISRAAKGKIKTHKGYRWEYE